MPAGQSKAWVRMFCSRDRRARVAHFVQVGSQWQLMKVTETSAKATSVPGKLLVNGSFDLSPEYRGCPACGNNSYVRCGSCGELGCWKNTTGNFACGNCGNSGPVSGSIESLSALEKG